MYLTTIFYKNQNDIILGPPTYEGNITFITYKYGGWVEIHMGSVIVLQHNDMVEHLKEGHYYKLWVDKQRLLKYEEIV